MAGPGGGESEGKRMRGESASEGTFWGVNESLGS